MSENGNAGIPGNQQPDLTKLSEQFKLFRDYVERKLEDGTLNPTLVVKFGPSEEEHLDLQSVFSSFALVLEHFE